MSATVSDACHMTAQWQRISGKSEHGRLPKLLACVGTDWLIMWVVLHSAPLFIYRVKYASRSRGENSRKKALSPFRLWRSCSRKSGVEAGSEATLKSRIAGIHHDGADSSPPLPPRRQRQWSRVTAPRARAGRGAAAGKQPAEVRSSAAAAEAVRVLRCGDPHPAVHVQRGALPQDRWVGPQQNLPEAHSFKNQSKNQSTTPQIPPYSSVIACVCTVSWFSETILNF